jgi:hypothetical protein
MRYYVGRGETQEDVQVGYLFWGLGHHPPSANRRPPHVKQQASIEQADKAVLADFMTLQSVWRRRPTLRGTAQERQAWKHLIQHLTKLPPPHD